MRLRAQVTLASTAAPAGAGEESPRTIAVSGRRLKVLMTPTAPLVPGGPAVHAELVLRGAEERSLLPPGIQFEVWERGRVGYGTVLSWA
jgi:hypothetical protein